jgi:ribosomal protein S27E
VHRDVYRPKAVNCHHVHSEGRTRSVGAASVSNADNEAVICAVEAGRGSGPSWRRTLTATASHDLVGSTGLVHESMETTSRRHRHLRSDAAMQSCVRSSASRDAFRRPSGPKILRRRRLRHSATHDLKQIEQAVKKKTPKRKGGRGRPKGMKVVFCDDCGGRVTGYPNKEVTCQHCGTVWMITV